MFVLRQDRLRREAGRHRKGPYTLKINRMIVTPEKLKAQHAGLMENRETMCTWRRLSSVEPSSEKGGWRTKAWWGHCHGYWKSGRNQADGRDRLRNWDLRKGKERCV